MKIKNILSLMTAVWLSAQSGLLAQLAVNPQSQTANPPSPTQIALAQLVQQVQGKVRAGKSSEADLADEIKTLDALIAGENGAKTDEAAWLVVMKAKLYLDIIKNTDKGVEIIKQMKKDYPDTKYGKGADEMLAEIAKAAAAAANPDKPDPGNLYAREAAVKKLQASLVVGGVFPDFTATDMDGKPLSVASRKGKVLLLDFWATWNGPSRTEMPKVIATYKKHHDEGFEIIGISLDADPDQLHAFLKQQDGMTWPQYYDGLGSSTKLAVKYGVEAVPFFVLIDPDGKIIRKDLIGDDLEDAVAKALAKK